MRRLFVLVIVWMQIAEVDSDEEVETIREGLAVVKLS